MTRYGKVLSVQISWMNFLKSIDEVEPEYQKFAFEQCCLVIGNHMRQQGRL